MAESRITNAPVGTLLGRPPVAPAWMPGIADFLPDWQGVRRQAAQSAEEVNADVAARNYGRALGSMLRGSAATGGAMATAVLDPPAMALRGLAGGVADFVRGVVGAPAASAPPAAPAPRAPTAATAPEAAVNPPPAGGQAAAPAGPTSQAAPASPAAATAARVTGFNRPEWDLVRGLPISAALPLMQQVAGRAMPRGPSGADIARVNGVQLLLRQLSALDASRGGMTPAEARAMEDNILRGFIGMSGGNEVNSALGDRFAQ